MELLAAAGASVRCWAMRKCAFSRLSVQMFRYFPAWHVDVWWWLFSLEKCHDHYTHHVFCIYDQYYHIYMFKKPGLAVRYRRQQGGVAYIRREKKKKPWPIVCLSVTHFVNGFFLKRIVDPSAKFKHVSNQSRKLSPLPLLPAPTIEWITKFISPRYFFCISWIIHLHWISSSFFSIHALKT